MSGRSPTADDGCRGDAAAAAGFERILRDAAASVPRQGFGPRTAVIADLRRALGTQVTRQEFDRGLRQLREEGCIGLEAHAHPDLLTPSEVQDALPDGSSVLYLIRWLR